MNAHTILFDAPTRDWDEALPIGNGFLGAMVHGGPIHEHLQINEDSLWSGGPMDRANPDARANIARIRQLLDEGKSDRAHVLAERAMFPLTADMRHYESLGDVWFDIANTDGEISGYRRVLDIDDALGSMQCNVGSKSIRAEYFASNPDTVIAYRMEYPAASKDGRGTEFAVRLSRQDTANGLAGRCDGITALDSNTIRLWGHNGGADGISYELVVRVVADEGTCRTAGSQVLVRGAHRVTVLVAGRTTYRSQDPLQWCKRTLDAAEELGYDRLRQRHLADYHEVYGRSSIELCDATPRESDASHDLGSQAALTLTAPQRLQRLREGGHDLALLETYLAFGRYLLISSSRPGSLPANLQGIWNRDYEPAWGSKYTININTEMNYWFAEKANLADLHMPLIEHIRAVHARGVEVARTMYGARGFVCHHNTDIWGDCAPQDRVVPATLWPMGGAWLCLHIIEHYRYSQDRDFIGGYFDILRDAVLFFMDTMVKDAQGYWITGPSVSPENTYRTGNGETGSLCMGPTMDTQILRQLFAGYLMICKDLAVDDELARKAHEHLEHLRPTRVGSDGRIMEWPEEYAETEPGHRHFSPLFGLYPGDEIRMGKTPELARAASRFIARRMDHGSGPSGWSKAWVILLYARLHEADHAWASIVKLLTDSTLNNLLDNHPPFQIDGNFGAVAGVLELIVQDYGDEVFLLPSLPAELRNGKVHGIRLKAGAEMDMEWDHGEIRKLILRATRDMQVSLVDNRSHIIRTLLSKGERLETAQW